MKTSTMLIIGVAAVGAYLAYKANVPKTATVTGYGGVAKTIKVDSNMTDAEISNMQQRWQLAYQSDDVAGAQNIIGELSGQNHPIAAAALVSVLNESLAQKGQGATAGYSAGAIRPIRALPSLGHHLVQPHRLAMLGRI